MLCKRVLHILGACSDTVMSEKLVHGLGFGVLGFGFRGFCLLQDPEAGPAYSHPNP